MHCKGIIFTSSIWRNFKEFCSICITQYLPYSFLRICLALCFANATAIAFELWSEMIVWGISGWTVVHSFVYFIERRKPRTFRPAGTGVVTKGHISRQSHLTTNKMFKSYVCAECLFRFYQEEEKNCSHLWMNCKIGFFFFRLKSTRNKNIHEDDFTVRRMNSIIFSPTKSLLIRSNIITTNDRILKYVISSPYVQFYTLVSALKPF